jgi:ADP-ribose pyrophosphatase YjhB (NUDIX family)
VISFGWTTGCAGPPIASWLFWRPQEGTHSLERLDPIVRCIVSERQGAGACSLGAACSSQILKISMKKSMWKQVSSKIVHQNPFFYVREDAVIQPSGGNGIYYVIEAGRSVMIVPLSRAGDLFLIKQHRYPTNSFSLEVPAGAHEGGGDLENARRELREETGLLSQDWTKLGDVQVMNGTANHQASVFLAENVDDSGIRIQEKEGITSVYKVAFNRVFNMIKAGELSHSESIMSITLAALFLRKL